MCSFTGGEAAQNLVVDRAADGTSSVRFKPVSATATPFAISDLITLYGGTATADDHHPVLLAGLFVLDLLVIHPFEDGNGRVARALTSALLIDHGYTVGRYVSLEQAIYDSSDAYYQALLESTYGWHDAAADPWPWLGYFTEIIADAYGVFADRAAAAKSPGTNSLCFGAPTARRVINCSPEGTGGIWRSSRKSVDAYRASGISGVPGSSQRLSWRTAAKNVSRESS